MWLNSWPIQYSGFKIWLNNVGIRFEATIYVERGTTSANRLGLGQTSAGKMV